MGSHSGDIIARSWCVKGALMSLLALFLVIFFIYIPLAMNLAYSMTNYSPFTRGNIAFIGFKNFSILFSDKDFGLIVKNTLYMAFLYVVILNILAIFFAVLVTHVRIRYGSFIKSLLYFPCLIAMGVVGYIWRVLYSYRDGLINTFLRFLGFSRPPEWLGMPDLIIPSTVIAVIWYALGYYVVIYYAGLVAIPQELYEASSVEGATRWHDFRYITLPLLGPSITINIILTSMAIIGTFDLPYTLTNSGGPGRFGTTIPLWIYNLYFKDVKFGQSIALSACLMAVAMVIALIELKILVRKETEI
jgi:ABC-type sugar transport system permease subunit